MRAGAPGRFDPACPPRNAIAEPPRQVNTWVLAKRHPDCGGAGSRTVFNRSVQSFAKRRNIGNPRGMSAGRIDRAMARINAALARIEAVHLARSAAGQASPASDGQGSARVMALVNAHEKLREEVADTIGQIDALIEEIEGE
jgi:hypothetical protein